MTLGEDKGFTLIESLVALIIMVTVATMLYQGLSSGLRVSGAAEGSETALRVAKARLAELGIETPLQPGTQEGQDGDILWQTTVWPYTAQDPTDPITQQNPYWARVKVTWRQGSSDRPRSLELTTLKLGGAQ
jgi:general secretion pathway protein I